MSDFESLNSAEFSYEKKGEGRVLLFRILLIVGYVLFLVAFFLFCYLTKLIPLFAVAPVFLWIVIFFTWRLVSYDLYFEFQSGMLTLGTFRTRKGERIKKVKLTLAVQSATEIAPYTKDVIFDGETVYDFSAAPSSDKRIFIRFAQNGKPCVAIFEGTARIGKLLTSFCPNAHDLKGKDFHG